MRIHRFSRRTGRLVATAVLTSGAIATLGAGAASAAATSTTTSTAKATAKPVATGSAGSAVFCAQLRTSQTAMSQLTAQTKDRYAKVAAEWAKIERFAPTGIKTDVTAIRTAYEKAAKQTGTAATATLSGAAAPGQRVTAFATKSCPSTQAGAGGGGGRVGGNGDGPGGAAFQAFQDCMAKNGATSFGVGGRRIRGGNGQAPQSPPTTDAKTAAALQKCQSLLPQGGLRAGRPDGGPGGAVGSPELQACLQAKGVTLPSFGGQNTGQNGGQNATRPTIDQKTRDAIEACRQQVNATRTASTTTVKKTTA